MTLDLANPQPGIYPDVPADVYRKIPAVSATVLKAMRRSPAHARWDMDHPRESDAMILGEAAHLAVLQPQLLPDRFCVAPECDRRTSKGKATWEAFCQANAGKGVLKADQMECVNGMARAVAGCPDAAAIVATAGPCELTIVWRDDATGLTCKARLDKHATDTDSIADLKTTTDARPDAFSRSIGLYGYDVQAAHYLAGAQAVGLAADTFGIIAVESEPPHGVMVYELDPADVERGYHQVRRLLSLYAECESSGIWPAYPPGIVRIGVTNWQAKQIDEQLAAAV